MASASNTLFKPLQVGSMSLKHRVAMAPLTRCRATADFVPSREAIKYYEQRAVVPGTLLITEATFISKNASGMPGVPGIWSDEQCAAWKLITDAVHAKGSFIYCQLWYLGRAAYAKQLAKLGLEVRSSGNIPIDEKTATPRAMSNDEIQEAIREYAHAAKTAMKAGFDGVEIHGANGYLIDQFLQDTCNNRTDRYGGSVENRVRFAQEVIAAVCDAVGPQNVALRMSPYSSFQGMKMQDPKSTFAHYVERLPKDLAYVHATESRVSGASDSPDNERETLDFIKQRWAGPFVVAGGFTPSTALKEAESDNRTVVAIGRYFISNPDLVAKIRMGKDLTRYDRSTFYTQDYKGYTDYPIDTDLVREAFGSQDSKI